MIRQEQKGYPRPNIYGGVKESDFRGLRAGDASGANGTREGEVFGGR